MAPRLSILLLLSAALATISCDPWSNSPGSNTGEPGGSSATRQRIENVPYCAGGQRDKGCVFGTNCRVTTQGCQVCQCEGLDD